MALLFVLDYEDLEVLVSSGAKRPIHRIVKLVDPYFVILVAPEFLRNRPLETKSDAKWTVIKRIVKLSDRSRRRLVHRRQTPPARADAS